jgi:hypothetical protein
MNLLKIVLREVYELASFRNAFCACFHRILKLILNVALVTKDLNLKAFFNRFIFYLNHIHGFSAERYYSFVNGEIRT